MPSAAETTQELPAAIDFGAADLPSTTVGETGSAAPRAPRSRMPGGPSGLRDPNGASGNGAGTRAAGPRKPRATGERKPRTPVARKPRATGEAQATGEPTPEQPPSR